MKSILKKFKLLLKGLKNKTKHPTNPGSHTLKQNEIFDELHIDYEEITGIKADEIQQQDKEFLDMLFKNLYLYTEENNKKILTNTEVLMTPLDLNDKKEVNNIFDPHGVTGKNNKKMNPFELKQCLMCQKDMNDNNWANSHTIPRASLKNISDKPGDAGTLTLYPNSYENFINKYRNENYLKPTNIEKAGTVKLLCLGDQDHDGCEKSKPFELKVNNPQSIYTHDDYIDMLIAINLYNIHHKLNSEYVKSINFDVRKTFNTDEDDSTYKQYKQEKLQDEASQVVLFDRLRDYVDLHVVWDSKDTHDDGVDINACIMLSAYIVWDKKYFSGFNNDNGCSIFCFPDERTKQSRCIIIGLGPNGIKLKNHFDALKNDEKENEFLFMAMSSNGLFALPNDSQFVDFLQKNYSTFLSEFKHNHNVQRIQSYEYYMKEIDDKKKLLSFHN